MEDNQGKAGGMEVVSKEGRQGGRQGERQSGRQRGKKRVKDTGSNRKK